MIGDGWIITLWASTFRRSIYLSKIVYVRSAGQSSTAKYSYFVDTWISLKTQCRTDRKKPACRNQLDWSTHFDRTPTYDRQTDRHVYETLASTRAGIASRGKNQLDQFRRSTIHKNVDVQSTFTPNAVPRGALASFSPQHDVFTPHFCGIASHRVNILGYNCKTQDHTRHFVPYLCQLLFAAILWVKLS